MIANQWFIALLRREIALTCLSFYQKNDSVMDFQTKYIPSLTLLDQTARLESDSESVTSTILTKNQFKQFKNDSVRPVDKNDVYHLVSSINTQPKIRSNTPAPPSPY